NDAIRVSGGATETAALAQAFVTRNGEQISARLNTISSTLPLEPNDVLTVPEFTASITGEVNKPGTYVLMPAKNATLAGLIEQAGGITEKAGLKKIRISTLQGSESQTQTVDASNPEILQSSKINSGDVVFIPEAEARKRHRISFKSVSQAALMLYTLFQVLSD
ncbi:MAG TPA: SLBB domain-containing protein, partial [Armatimonadota bacterium]|nr:SLBB domain-containing protein [Armatimonadota bacterium]